MNVILDGTFRCVHACLPALRKSGGSIVNIGGMSAHIGSKDRAHVMTAKAALVGFSRALAHDLAADKITANCVVPGAIDTTRPASSQTPAHHLTHGTITGERGKAARCCGDGALFCAVRVAGMSPARPFTSVAEPISAHSRHVAHGGRVVVLARKC